MLISDDTIETDPYLEEALRAFGRHLAGLRKQRSWSQERLALESGLARSYLGGIERGQRNLSFKNLVRLADTLAIPMPELLDFDLQSCRVIAGLEVSDFPDFTRREVRLADSKRSASQFRVQEPDTPYQTYRQNGVSKECGHDRPAGTALENADQKPKTKKSGRKKSG